VRCETSFTIDGDLINYEVRSDERRILVERLAR